LNEGHFRYTYEFADEFNPFPTWAVILAHSGLEPMTEKFNIPGFPEFNPMMLLHGEESLFFHKHLEVGKTYKMQEFVSDV
jgi:hypothetical protein